MAQSTKNMVNPCLLSAQPSSCERIRSNVAITTHNMHLINAVVKSRDSLEP